MKKTFICILAIGLFLSSRSQGHKIEIQIKDNTDSAAIIGYHFGNQRLIHDTIQFDSNNTLKIVGESPLDPGIYFVYTPGFYFEFIVREQDFKLVTTMDGGYRALEVERSAENALFKEFQVGMIDNQRTQQRLTDSLKLLSGEDSISFRKELEDVIARSIRFRDELIKQNEGTFFSDFAQMMIGVRVPDFDEIEDEQARRQKQYRHYKSHYFDLVDDPKILMKTPVFYNYVMKYFDELIVPAPDSLIMEIDAWLERTIDHEPTFRYWLVTFFKKYQESKVMGMDAVWIHLGEKYYLSGKADWVTEESLQQIKEEVRFIKPNLIGSYAPALNSVDTTLRPFSLSQLDEDYLILFFYDPDCGHCKKKTPVLKEIYPKIQDLGGEVVAICTTTDIDKWKKYVRDNQMKWVNLGDPFGRSNFRVDYNVRSTPQVYVLDRDKTIVGKKLDIGDQLIDFMENHHRLNP